MKNKKQLFLTIIFFGGIWGIVEATVGYVLHIIPGLSLYMSGAVLFGFASYILYKAYAVTNSRSSLLMIGFVAAAIKTINFFLPLPTPFKVINPMMSIIFESLMVIAVVGMLNKDSLKQKISGLLLASIGWRVIFFAYMGFQYVSSGFIYIQNLSQYVQFFGIYAIGSTLFALAIFALDKAILTKKNISLNIKPIYSLASIALAIVLTVVTMLI